MKLEEQDAELFDQLYFPLLTYVNKECQICPELETIDQGSDAEDTKVIADYLWAHTRILETYLSETELPEEHAQIIASWKQCKTGRFVVERHLKKGSVFISEDDYRKVYIVKGTHSTWEEVVGKAPVLVDTVLLPFRDCIISDRIVVTYPDLLWGSREGYKRTYMRAKEGNAIISSLNSKKAEWHPRKKKATGTVESYEIKVDLRDDCYRVIRIGKQETLEDLSETILDAFDFDNDHCHAFFMDDRYWSKTNAYYSDYMEEYDSSSDVTLWQLRLKKGEKFKYLFDFGDEWRFQCKVLRELEEKTDGPVVTQVVGKAPEQYPSWDDEE